MVRSFRGLGLVVLLVLVVAPLTLFAVLSVFEDEPSDAVRLSLDGETWSGHLREAAFASAEPWTAGETRSVIAYVQNSGSASVDVTMTVASFSTDDLVGRGHLDLAVEVEGRAPVAFEAGRPPRTVEVDGVRAGSTVPVTVVATFGDTAPPGATVADEDVVLDLRIRGARTVEAGRWSFLDAAGAQLWLAPVLLVAAAGVAVRVRRARATRPASPTSEPDPSPEAAPDVTADPLADASADPARDAPR